MPGETDLYFPIEDAEYEAQFLDDVKFAPIPSIWGHAAGAGWDPEDAEFLNSQIREFLDKAASAGPN